MQHQFLWLNNIKKTLIALICLTVILFAACEEANSTEPGDSTSQESTDGDGYIPPIIGSAKVPVVYTSGWENNSEGVAQPRYWEDKEVKILTDNGYGGEANSIIKTNADIYVAGFIYESDSIKKTAVYWKFTVNSSTMTVLDDNQTDETSTNATDIVVSDGSVHVSGWEKNDNIFQKAVYWKDGVKTELTDGTFEAEARTVFLEGSDVYIAGYEEHNTGQYGVLKQAKYWLNGDTNGVAVNTSVEYDQSEFYDIYSDGSDLYAAGSGSPMGESAIAHLWKNNTSIINVTIPPESAEFLSFTKSGSTLYTAGSSNLIATYWQDGTALTLDTDPSTATSIFVLSDIVYCAGHSMNYAVYWRNNIMTELSDGTTCARGTSIFVD